METKAQIKVENEKGTIIVVIDSLDQRPLMPGDPSFFIHCFDW